MLRKFSGFIYIIIGGFKKKQDDTLLSMSSDKFGLPACVSTYKDSHSKTVGNRSVH
jgi:hypothetical protein